MRRSFDVVIVGGGAMGSSAAYWLARGNKTGRANLKVAVVERDATYAQAASALSAGGLRQQFSNKENILLSQASLQHMVAFEQECAASGQPMAEGPALPFGFRDHGYLVLSGTDEGRAVLRQNVDIQRGLGARTIFMSDAGDGDLSAEDPAARTILGYPADYKAKHLHRFEHLATAFPWMSLEGIVAAGYGAADEGWFDAFSYVSAVQQYNRTALGVEYITGEVVDVAKETDAATHVKVATASGDTQSIYFGHMINAGGTRAAALAEKVGWQAHPVRPKKRYTFHVQCDSWRLGQDGAFWGGAEGAGQLPMPLLVDPSGVWVRPEGVGFICGGPLPPHLDTACGVDDFDVGEEAQELYEDVIWPSLAARIPSFETLRLGNQWTGHYEYNLADQNAIIGYHPSCANVVYLNGFSGHGIQQAPAAGRAAAELILTGGYKTIDVTAMAPTRFDADRLLVEKNVI